MIEKYVLRVKISEKTTLTHTFRVFKPELSTTVINKRMKSIQVANKERLRACVGVFHRKSLSVKRLSPYASI